MRRKEAKVGMRVTCLHEVEAYYSRYPKGRPEVIFKPGMIAIVASVAPKVRITGEPPVHDKLDEFIVVDYVDSATNKQERVSLNFCNAKRI